MGDLRDDTNLDDLSIFDYGFDPSCPLSNDVSVMDPLDSSPESVSLTVEDIERLLMVDDDGGGAALENGALDQQISDNERFFSDILLDSPLGSDGSDLVIDGSDGKDLNGSEEDKMDGVRPQVNNSDKEDDDDPIAKKRKRQLRNRDAAVRSRERKKMYVRDLEMKSRYFETECKRLAMLLQCCYAENQALRLSLHNSKALDASRTRQESAVLLLESLLLGSLLWFLVIITSLLPPGQLQSTLNVVSPGGVEDRSLFQRKTAANKNFGFLVFQSLRMGKRCSASKTRMKPSFFALEVLV